MPVFSGTTRTRLHLTGVMSRLWASFSGKAFGGVGPTIIRATQFGMATPNTQRWVLESPTARRSSLVTPHVRTSSIVM